jgi:hypothetical protein
METARGIAITGRDTDVLLSLYEYRYLTMGQLRRLHFPSQQTTARRIRVLREAGYVDDFRPIGGQERLVTLDAKGAAVVGEYLGLSSDDFGWKRSRKKPKDYYFIQHFIALNDFRIAVARACAVAGELELVRFIPEYEGEVSKGVVRKRLRDVVRVGPNGREEITHTPDGAFALRKNGETALFFVEVDRGTESLSHPKQGLVKTVAFYLNYLVADGYQRYREDFGVVTKLKGFRVLIVVPSKRRLENVRRVAASFDFRPERAKGFLWIAQAEDVSERTVFSGIWKSLAADDNKTYAIDGG